MNNIFNFSISTGKREEFINITHLLNRAVKDSGIQNGMAVVYCPHTTAGITINENADPDVVYDIIKILDRAFPAKGLQAL